MDATPDLGSALAAMFSELVDGPPQGESYMLNQGDKGLLHSLERVDWQGANRGAAGGGAPIAQHVEHLRYGISLLNRWAGGEEDSFAGADWGKAWTTTVASEKEWTALCGALTRQLQAWKDELQSVRTGEGLAPMAVKGMIGSIAHLAYHMGAIRQIDRATRGPTHEESRAAGKA